VRRRNAGAGRYAQDWFNMVDFDCDYESVTRVTRDPAAGKIRGEGFHIAPFVLDDTLQNLHDGLTSGLTVACNARA
jgi:hypothetical protein